MLKRSLRLIHCNTLKFQDKPILRTGQKSALNFSKLMRTKHISMTSTFQCQYCQCFTFKRCDKLKLKCTGHGGMYSAHYLGKISITSNRECCNAEFWQVRRIGLSWNFFKMLQRINLNESSRPYYIHYEDYVKRF